MRRFWVLLDLNSHDQKRKIGKSYSILSYFDSRSAVFKLKINENHETSTFQKTLILICFINKSLGKNTKIIDNIENYDINMSIYSRARSGSHEYIFIG